MRIDKLAIDKFKNLENFFIDFDEKALTTVILGRNGTGKSNLLEALIIIFRDLDLGEPPTFKYRLDYRCRGYTVHVDADPDRPQRMQVHIRVGREGKYGEDEIPYQRFAKETDRRYLPSYVFGYYSGPSNRMEAHFEKHQKRFYDQLIKGQGSEKPLRPLV